MSADSPDWRFVQRHRTAVAVFVLAAAAALAELVYVFLWFVGGAQSSGMVPDTVGQWTMENLVNFIIYSLFWEILLVGIPVAVVALVAWRWWRKLPEEERRGCRFRRSRSTGGSGSLGLFFFIAFVIKVYLDGKWTVAISSFTVKYVVASLVTILEWTAGVVGIPAAIGLAWWVNKQEKGPG